MLASNMLIGNFIGAKVFSFHVLIWDFVKAETCCTRNIQCQDLCMLSNLGLMLTKFHIKVS